MSDGIIRERDERGHHIVGPCWWKLSFDIKTPTWQKYGILAFAEAYTEVEGREAALAQARKDYVGAEIIEISFAPCKKGEAERYETKRRRLVAWLRNTRDGVPNTPDVLMEGRTARKGRMSEHPTDTGSRQPGRSAADPSRKGNE